MRIVQITAEFAPIAKAGGMGEVLLGLSRELIAQHHTVEVLLPKYSLINHNSLNQLKIETADLRIVERGESISNTIWSAVVEDCPLHLFEARHPSGYFHRDKIYGYPDDVSRFLYFCRVAMEYLKQRNESIDILHLHDWHTAACASLARDVFADSPKIGAILFTIHNLEYQGKCDASDLAAIGLRPSSDKLQDPDPKFPKTINLLKGGIFYADAVNTVSPSYAKEILTREKGFGLDELLRKKPRFSGILNGIDSKSWDPAADPYLAACYSPQDSLRTIKHAKFINKNLIQKRFGCRCTDRPFLGIINRLVPQKGLSLIQKAIGEALSQGAAFAILGSSPIPEIQKQFDQLKDLYQGNPHVLLHYEYSDEVAHLLYAAFDFLLVPSLFEPCGLTQIIALRYGTIPIVRATGGLKDTIFDCEDGLIPQEKRNGFIFHEPTLTALQAVMQRALALFRTDPGTHQIMVQRAMRSEVSWTKPAQAYLKLYRQITSNTR